VSSDPKLDEMVMRVKKGLAEEDMKTSLENGTRDGPIISKSQYKRVTMQMKGGDLFNGKTNA